MDLRQNNPQIIRFGPFLDSTDGVTPETALTITQADMQLSRDGAAFAQKSAAGNATHDVDGWYSTTLSTTDTLTAGILKLQVNVSGALPVWENFDVVSQTFFDATHTGTFNNLGGIAQTVDNDTKLTTLLARIIGTLESGSHNPASVAQLGTLTDWINGGRLDLILDIIAADTTTDIPALIAALNDFNPASDDVAVVTLVNTLTTYTNDTPQSADNDTKLTTLLARIIGTLATGTHNPATAAQIAVLSDWINGGRLDLILDIIAQDTTTDIPALIAALNNISAAQVNAECDTAIADFGPNTVVPDPAGTAPTVAEILAGGDIDGFTLEESHKLLLAASVGILAGAATNSITIQAADGSKTRITATVDSDGNRSVVVKDVTG